MEDLLTKDSEESSVSEFITSDERFSKGGSEYQLKHLWSHHHEILRRLCLGQRSSEIAVALNICKQTVSNVRNSELGRMLTTALDERRDDETSDIAIVIREEAEESFYFMREIRKGNHEATLNQRIKAAESMLDREPLTARVRRTEGKILHGHLTKDDIDEIKRQSREVEAVAIDRGMEVVIENKEED